jgi:predicted PurR-regulated permease PerM
MTSFNSSLNRRVFAGLVAIAFFYVASPMVFPIATGGILAVLFSPWVERLEKKNLSRSICSALLTFGITILVLVPASILIFFSVKSGFYQLQNWKKSQAVGGSLLNSFLNTPKIYEFMVWLTSRIPINMMDLSTAFQDLAGSVGAKLAEFLSGVLTHLPGMVVALSVVVVSIYFFLVDGPKLLLFLRRNSIFSPTHTEQLVRTVAEMCRSVILAAIVSGGTQAVLEVLTCVLTATPNAAFVGLLIFLASFIPLVGSLPVTLGVAVQQLLEGRQVAGITLLVMAVVILAVDNTIRPWFLKGSANLHPFLGFIAAFGGLQTLGFLGVFLGPILAALFVATIQIFSESENENEAARNS